MRSLSGRLFASTLAALALTLALTIGIGAVLTRRQVDRSHAASLQLARRQSRAAAARLGELQDRERALGGRVRVIVAPRAQLRALRPRREPLERRHDDLSRRARPLLVPDAAVARPPAADARRARRLRGIRSCATSCSSAAAGVALAALLSLVVARSIGRPIRRVADATRGIAAAETHEPLPETGAVELAELARAFNEMAEQLRASRDVGACLPALGQPRAEDAADGDPRLGRGPRGRCVRACRRRADDRPRVATGSSGSSTTCSIWRG